MGFVYVLSTQDGFYKIGRTRNLQNRLMDLRIALPYKLTTEMLFQCEVGREREVEAALHDIFSERRMNGEWFKLTAEDLQWLWQDPLPLLIPVSHAICCCQECLCVHADEGLEGLMVGLS